MPLTSTTEMVPFGIGCSLVTNSLRLSGVMASARGAWPASSDWLRMELLAGSIKCTRWLSVSVTKIRRDPSRCSSSSCSGRPRVRIFPPAPTGMATAGLAKSLERNTSTCPPSGSATYISLSLVPSGVFNVITRTPDEVRGSSSVFGVARINAPATESSAADAGAMPLRRSGRTATRTRAPIVSSIDTRRRACGSPKTELLSALAIGTRAANTASTPVAVAQMRVANWERVMLTK